MLAHRTRYALILFASLLAARSVAAPPNVVLILIDDLSHYGVTAYGANRLSSETDAFPEQEFSTPCIDDLAREGVRCTNAHVYPLCEPTRVALLSGQYNSRNFVRAKSLHASQITIADLFQRAGYATGVYGKWKQSRGTPRVPAKDYLHQYGWDEFCCFDVLREGSRYINPNLVINGEIVDYKQVGGDDPETGRRWYGPDICNRHALDFIDRHKEAPFFLFYPMILVHSEHTPTPDTKPASAYDEFPDTWCDNRPCPGDDLHYFPDMVAYTDKLIGRVVDHLDRLGLRENTVVVVMGDNGTKEPFSHHLPDGSVYPGGKGDTKDNGTHVPLIVSCPRDLPRPGSTYDGLVDVVDILPTLCEAGGVELSDSVTLDGLSFWPQLTDAAGASDEHRDHIYTWYNANIPWTDTGGLLRYAFDKQFKRYAPNDRFQDGRFFDLRVDLLETAGDREEIVSWGHRRRSGIPTAELTDEQREAYERLGEILAENESTPVQSLRIVSKDAPVSVGGAATLRCEVSPPDATRANVIWESSDPSIATVNKFGEVTGRRPGEATITVYSWEDAQPVAAGSNPEFLTDGIQDSVTVRVTD